MQYKVCNPFGVTLLLLGLFSQVSSIPLAADRSISNQIEAQKPGNTLQPNSELTLNANTHILYIRETRGSLSASPIVSSVENSPTLNDMDKENATGAKSDPTTSHKRALKEATFILRPTLSEQAVTSNIRQITNLLEQHGIKVDAAEWWGLKLQNNGKKGHVVRIKFRGSASFPNINFGSDVISYVAS